MYIQSHNPFAMNKYLYIQNRNPFTINKSVVYGVPGAPHLASEMWEEPPPDLWVPHSISALFSTTTTCQAKSRNPLRLNQIRPPHDPIHRVE
jgi:hypothetical protein